MNKMSSVFNEYKELLSVLPRNNIKNSKEFYNKATQYMKEAKEYKDKVLIEINNRAKELEASDEIPDYDAVIKKYKENIKILNEYNDYYEKSSLDIILKNIRKYYKNNIFKVNYDIYLAIKSFKNVGVELTSDDFMFGRENNEYMNTFFKENDINSQVLKEKFDDLYWKSPDFILYICLNFKHLYYKNIKKFKKYYTDEKIKIYDGETMDYVKEFKSFLIKFSGEIHNNPKYIQDMFLTNKLDIKEFSKVKIENLKKDFIIDEYYKDEEVFLELENTLKEYRYLSKYKYIIDEVIKLYKEKTGKNDVKSLMKSIDKKESKINKINRRIAFFKRFRKNSLFTEQYIKINEILKELDIDYDNLESLRFKDAINNKLNDSSTYLDALMLINSYKNSLVNIIKKQDSDYNIIDELNMIEDFLYLPDNSIMNNILLLDDRSIIDVIIDKYKLMNISLEKEKLTDNLDGIIKIVEIINMSIYMFKNNMEYDDILFLVNAKKILESNKESKE